MKSDLVAIQCHIEECEARLSTRDRRAVFSALTNRTLEGHQPTPEEVALLVEFAADEITFEQYKARVLDRLDAQHQPRHI